MWSPLIETFLASLKDPFGLPHAKHHVFPSSYVEYLSSLWMPFKPAKSLVLLCSRVMWSLLSKHFQLHWRIHLGFTMLSTMCFQFILLNIYHLYGFRLKGRTIMHRANVFPFRYVCMYVWPQKYLWLQELCALLLVVESCCCHLKETLVIEWVSSILHTRQETFCQGWLAGNWLMSEHLQQVSSRV
jgi:hypothetical protein